MSSGKEQRNFFRKKVKYMKAIILKISGPLQAWGTDSHFNTRHTDDHPSKSGVIGMIAAGLGCGRNDDETLKKLNELKFAVRVDQPGQILRDYHTVKKDKPDRRSGHTYVTNRYCLEDAVFLVALSSDDDELIKTVENAVKIPYFQPFLGRRALPPTADMIQGIVEGDAITALKEYPWQAAEWYKRKHHEKMHIYADADLLPDAPSRIRNDKAISFSQKRGRKFDPRREAHIIIDAFPEGVGVTDSMDDHDAFGAIGEE